LELFVHLLVLLVLTRAFGEGAARLGQPSAVGELIAGIVLAAVIAGFGADVPFLASLADSALLDFVADFGIFFLVLMAGIEMRPRELAESSKTAFVVALGGMIIPLAAGFGLAWIWLPETDLHHAQAFLVGVAVSISAIPATVKVLMDFGVLHQRFGRVIVSAAVFDDIFGLMLLALLTGVMQRGEIPDAGALALLVVKVAAFFAITVTLGVHVYPRLSRRIKETRVAALEFSALLGVGLAYGLLAEALGMHWVIGAFMAGLYYEQPRVGEPAYSDMKLVVGTITSGFLGPLFFATIGMRVDLGAVTAVPVFLVTLLVVAFLGKFIGAGLPALMLGLPRREAAAVGIGMGARGAVELVVLSISYEAGLFAATDGIHPVVDNLYSSLVVMAVVTTLAAPLLLRRVLAVPQGADPSDERSRPSG